MKKYFTFFYSVESKLGTKKIFENSKLELFKDTYSKTAKLLDSVRLSPDQEVINKILKNID